jgi:hypothetical protein
MRFWITISLAASVTACTQAQTPQLCAGAGMIETRLYFGLSEPSGRLVTDRQFADFVAKDVTPVLPEGFTILEGRGFWKDGKTSRTISENSKVLVRLHPATTDASAALDRIADAYKARFQQESVLRTDSQVCADFR